MNGQLEMFSGVPPEEPEPEPVTSRRKPPGGSPQRATEVMSEINLGRYGVLDVTDRIVWFVDDRQVRHSADEDVVVSLMDNGYAVERADRYRVSCRHGAVIRPVTPLRLTPAGQKILARWLALVPLPTGRETT
jgi:hypothetical protein